MADLTRTIEIIFAAVDNTGGAIKSVGSGITSFSSAAADAIAPLDQLAGAIKAVDALVVGLGIALGGASLQKAGEFGDGIKQIGVLFEGTSAQVKAFGVDVLNYAGNSTVGLKDIDAALKDAIGSGVKYGESIEFIAKAETLALGASGSLASATNVLVSSMNAYGAKTDEAAKFTDTLMQTVLLGKTTLPELAQALSNVTGTAAAAKVPFEDVNAAIAAMTAAGAPTSQAVTAINQAITQLIKPSKEAKDLAAELGINFSATALATDGFKGTLDKVYKATGGNIEQLGILFGSVDALKAATILGADKAGIFSEALKVMTTTSGSAARAAETLRDQWSVATQQMVNSADILLVRIGQKLNEDGDFGRILNSLKDIFKSLTFSVNAGAFDDVFDTFKEMGAELVEFLQGIAKALPAALEQVDFSKFLAAASSLPEVFRDLFGNINLATPEGLARVIQVIADTLGNLLNAGAGIARVWVEAAQAAAPLVEKFSQMDAASARAAGSTLGFADVLTVVLGGIGSVGKGLEALGTGIELLAGAQIAKLVAGFVTGTGAMDALLVAARATGVALGVAGQAGLVGAAGAAGYAVGGLLADGVDLVVRKLTGAGSLGSLIYDLTHNTEDLAEAAPAAAKALNDMGEGAERAAKPMAGTETSIEGVGAASEKTGKQVDEFMIQSMIRMAVAAGDAKTKNEFLAASAAALKNPTAEARIEMNNAAAAFKDAATRSGDVASASSLIRSEYEKLQNSVPKAAQALKTTSDVMEVLSKKTDLTNKDLIELAKNTKAAEIELEKIASNERIKLIEARVTLNVAQIEAETKRIEAAFESINTTIDSTGELLGGLFGLLAGSDLTWAQIRALESQIEKENVRRDKALEMQQRLTNAQIDQMRAQTKSIESGDALIKVDGAGLQPHLEAFMWEILRTIQVRVNRDGMAMLLGF